MAWPRMVRYGAGAGSISRHSSSYPSDSAKSSRASASGWAAVGGGQPQAAAGGEADGVGAQGEDGRGQDQRRWFAGLDREPRRLGGGPGRLDVNVELSHPELGGDRIDDLARALAGRDAIGARQ